MMQVFWTHLVKNSKDNGNKKYAGDDVNASSTTVLPIAQFLTNFIRISTLQRFKKRSPMVNLRKLRYQSLPKSLWRPTCMVLGDLADAENKCNTCNLRLLKRELDKKHKPESATRDERNLAGVDIEKRQISNNDYDFRRVTQLTPARSRDSAEVVEAGARNIEVQLDAS